MSDLFSIGIENYQKKYQETVARFKVVDLESVIKSSKIDNVGEVFTKDMPKLLTLCKNISRMAGERSFGTVQYAAAISVLADYMNVTFDVSAGCCIPRGHDLYNRTVEEINSGKAVVPNAIVITVDGIDYAYSLGTNEDVEGIQLIQIPRKLNK